LLYAFFSTASQYHRIFSLTCAIDNDIPKGKETISDCHKVMFNFLKPVDPSISCSKCGGSVPVGSNFCNYCGTKYDSDLVTLKYGMELTKTDRECPDCKTELNSVDLQIGHKFLVEKCGECYGVFLDKLELEELLKLIFSYPGEPDTLRLFELLDCPDRQKENVKYRNCPVCSCMMARRNFGRRSGVVMDVCPNHGTWLDGGEISQLIKWSTAGGQHSRCILSERESMLNRNAEERKMEILRQGLRELRESHRR